MQQISIDEPRPLDSHGNEIVWLFAESFSAEGSRCAECNSPIDEEEIIGDGTSRGECCACWACYEELGVCNDKRDCARWEDEWDDYGYRPSQAESFDAERWKPKPSCEECGAVEGGRIDGCDDCNFTYWFNGKVYHPDSMIHIGAESFGAEYGKRQRFGNRYVARNTKGEFISNVGVGASLKADRRNKSKTPARSGFGNRGDSQKGAIVDSSGKSLVGLGLLVGGVWALLDSRP